MELPHICGTLFVGPGGGQPFEIRRQTVRIADECHPLPLLRQPPRLLDREERLAAPGAAPHLDTVQQPDRVENHRLLGSECVRRVFVRDRPRNHVALREAPSGEDRRELIDPIGGQGRAVQLLTGQHLPQPRNHVIQVGAINHLPARAFRQGEVVGDRHIGEHHHVVPSQPPVAPARVGLHVAAQGIQRVTCLPDRVDDRWSFSLLLVPIGAVVPDLPALHLQADDSVPFERHHEVDLVVLEPVGDSLVCHHQVTVAELNEQCIPHRFLGSIHQTRILGDTDHHAATVARLLRLSAAIPG